MTMEITNIQITDDMLKDILKLDLAPGGNDPVWQTMMRGITILNCLPRSATQVTSDKCKQDDWRETAATRTYADAEKKGKGQPRMTAGNYDKLKKM